MDYRILDKFTRAWALWMLRQDFAPTAVDAAVDALLAGLDDDPLGELAGLHLPANPFEAHDLMQRSTETLGLDYSEMTKSAAETIVLRHYVLAFQAGSISLEQLTSWTHAVIGHGDPSPAQAIVELDDDLALSTRKTAALAPAVLQQFLDATADSSAGWRTSR
jgi:hypothetical protein